jgi:hypothetical protein
MMRLSKLDHEIGSPSRYDDLFTLISSRTLPHTAPTTLKLLKDDRTTAARCFWRGIARSWSHSSISSEPNAGTLTRCRSGTLCSTQIIQSTQPYGQNLHLAMMGWPNGSGSGNNVYKPDHSVTLHHTLDDVRTASSATSAIRDVDCARVL